MGKKMAMTMMSRTKKRPRARKTKRRRIFPKEKKISTKKVKARAKAKVTMMMMVREKKMMMMRKNRYSACVKPAPVGIFILHLFQPIFFSCLITSFHNHQNFPPTSFSVVFFFFLNIILVFLNILRHNLIAVADLCHCSCVTQVHFPGVFFFFFTKKKYIFCLVCL